MSALVGRAREVARIGAALDDLTSGATLAIAGEPGIGKTRLLDELARAAEERGALVLAARASEVERELPFGVLVDALEPHLGSLDAAHEPYDTPRAARTLLERLAADRPLVLVLDDVHWADPATTSLVAHLVRRPPAAPVLLALAYRTAQIPELLVSALGAADRDGTLHALHPGPLDRDDADALVGGDLGTETIDVLYAESGGNPFYLGELARASRRGRRIIAAPATSAAPPAVAAALLDELRTLSPFARLVLEAASVVGEPFDPELSAAAADVGATEVLDALDELLDGDLVRQTVVPRQFAFRHPLVRRGVHETTKGGWRLGVHARAAAELARQGAAPASRAHHLEQSAQRGNEAAIADLRAAAEAAGARAPATAARWYAAALRLLPESDDARRMDLLLPLAAAESAAGRIAEAHAALLAALALRPDDIALIVECAALEGWLGRHDDAHARLERAVRTTRNASLLVALAVNAVHRMRFDDVRAYGAEALEQARTPGEVGAAAAVLSLGETATGSDAQAHRDLATERLGALTDDELGPHLDALFYLGWASTYATEHEAARRCFERGVALCRTSGNDRLLVPFRIALADTYLLPGPVAMATELAAATTHAARLSPNSHDLPWALWQQAWTALFAGDFDLAVAAGREGYERSHDLPSYLVFIGDAGWTYGLALVASGDAEQGRALMLEAVGADLKGVVPSDRAWVCDDIVWTELERGDVAAAATWADRAMQIAGELGGDWPQVHARRARARVLLAQGEPAAAAEHALASAEAARRCRDAVDAGASQAIAGRAFAAAGDAERALNELRAAEEALARCGADAWRRDAARDLRRLGQRVRRSTPGSSDARGLEALTGREREIADLVAERRTNREIAAALFLSEKTIETHLRNIFSKLRVTSRVAVAHAVEADRPA
jgi:DNA-binding NarL/FixJ family response regulator